MRPRSYTVITCMLHFMDYWTSCIDKCQSLDIVYFDFEKAFDGIPHRRLIHKLEHNGIRGMLLAWIEAFLSNRFFKVEVGNAYSVKCPVVSGVPQGSVLGPLLFSLYIMDLRHLLQSNYSLYADDCKICSNPCESSLILQNDVDTLSDWSKKWLILLNINKCSVLHMGKTNPFLTYKIESHELQSVKEVKDLGFTITSDMSWSSHICKIVKRANTVSYLLFKPFNCPKGSLAQILYKTYVRPILEFGNVIWSPWLLKDKNLFEGVQRKFTKKIPTLTGKPYNERLAELDLPPLEERRLTSDFRGNGPADRERRRRIASRTSLSVPPFFLFIYF
jgi:ribonuclease P/MRP protein subunit RPP40